MHYEEQKKKRKELKEELQKMQTGTSRNNYFDNMAWIVGVVAESFTVCDKLSKKIFYKSRIIVERNSGNTDYVPIIISEEMRQKTSVKKDSQVEIRGAMRTYNIGGKLLIYLLVKEMKEIDLKEDVTKKTLNKIYLEGYICKDPMYRQTPLGRKITDLVVAVNRPFYESDYMPVITWGNNAIYSKEIKVGEKVFLIGRMQSRDYTKRYEKVMQDENLEPKVEQVEEKRIAYELSVGNIMTESDYRSM